jgi:hypothetical protein
MYIFQKRGIVQDELPASGQLVLVGAKETHTSVLLQGLIDSTTDDHFTLEWLIGHLPKNSFGIVMLFLSLISLLPIISVVSRLLMIVLALQIILGYHSPVLPNRLTRRPLPSHYLTRLDRHAIPALRHLEKAVRPRWPGFLLKARGLTACTCIVLLTLSLLAPIPFANVPPAVIGILMALSYIEHDGVLLSFALFMSFLLLGILLAMVVVALM